MAINQSQVDHILSSASADDPEVKLQNLQDEVDLLKKSVKKLLIDLRERLNETENPFIVTAMIPPSDPGQLKDKTDPLAKDSLPAVPEEEISETEEISDINTDDNEIAPANFDLQKGYKQSDAEMLAALRKRVEDINRNAEEIPPETKTSDRPRLQKLHRLFEWVSRMVNKYGHDRLRIMTESYVTMGYISEEAAGQIKEISKLMPESSGECNEISSEEFVAELYVLNRILIPDDSSLDREMIEVIMEKRTSKDPLLAKLSEEESYEEDWIEMLEKV
ncbi:hypothetical protein F1737_02435 [Methanoplanus sp. FWC-SCC4]|uniref:Archaeal flagella protein FlaD/E domain-containing protein n=1 Tax=Methanochimaera problematica TaxID=2609417 RepID=A0AA97FCP2_9EURY|nr:hypothetical protein [Methanoplanus sp. FWC-SCC4]WOF15623.1 hypothetical protein F1737_02435 [Methanoplanus sp. FWC-SCC4]